MLDDIINKLIKAPTRSMESEEDEDSEASGDEDTYLKGDVVETMPPSEDESPTVDTENEVKKEAFFAQPDEASSQNDFPDFASLNLSKPILRALITMGFSKPTPIQAKTIPSALLEKDNCGSAVTGSGKTAAFLIPIIERLLYRSRNLAKTRVVILMPTRELATQCFTVATQLSQFTDVTTALVVGGLPMRAQELKLRELPDIIIATPGRLNDHIQNSQSFDLDSVEILVIDEADRMLEIGFIDEVKEIVSSCRNRRQTLLFSATMTDDVSPSDRLSVLMITCLTWVT